VRVCLFVILVFDFSGPTVILGYVGVTAVAGYVYYLTCKKVRQDSIEMRSAKLALMPLLTAERDREYVSSVADTILFYHEF
jgi:hypothetical protein